MRIITTLALLAFSMVFVSCGSMTSERDPANADHPEKKKTEKYYHWSQDADTRGY